jgi:hypothetical protein
MQAIEVIPKGESGERAERLPVASSKYSSAPRYL